MKTYHYSKEFRSQHRKYTSLVFSILLLLLVFGTAIVDLDGLLKNPIFGVLLLLGVVANVVYDLYRINMYPNLKIGENGLEVEFFGFYIPVRWKNVESITHIQSRSYPEKFTEWFVRTRRLTAFHLLYGKSKYGDYVTGFLVQSEIENVQQVLDTIGSKLAVNNYATAHQAEDLD
jgi:hypothetical protein